MTAEAELCPQCGGAIHFPPAQTELICPYCGATITHHAPPPVAPLPAAPAEPADQQDRVETNKIIAALVVLRRKLAAQGLVLAQIVSVKPRTSSVVRTDPTSDQGNGRMMSLELEVRPDGQPPFAASATVLIRVATLAEYHPGAMVYVRYDPHDPTQILLDHRA